LSPSLPYAETPFSRAIPVKRGTKPWSRSPWTDGGRRTTVPRPPRAAIEAAATSEATRRIEWKSNVGSHGAFDRKATWYKQRSPKGDDERAVGARERGTEGRDGAPVYLAVGLELREVVDEGHVNHAIRFGGSAAQAFQVFKIASMYLALAAISEWRPHPSEQHRSPGRPRWLTPGQWPNQ
jgi:hypothetical protein